MSAQHDGRVVPKIRDFAKGKPCQMRTEGVCRYDGQYSIWSHAPFGSAGKGRSIKSFDICGAITCTACDAALDQPTPALLRLGLTRQSIENDFMHAHFRSLVMLVEAGLVRFK